MKRTFIRTLILFVLAIASIFLHNLFYGIFKIEEPVFFTIAIILILSLPFYFIYQLTKNILLSGVIFFILVLDWAAFHDIAAGREPTSELIGEYLILIISLPVFLIIGYLIYRKKRLKHK